MRLTENSSIATFVFLGHVGGALSTISSNGFSSGIPENSVVRRHDLQDTKHQQNIFGLQGQVDYKSCHENTGGGFYPETQECRTDACPSTSVAVAATIITHPKITPAPLLYKRKLGSNKWDLIHDDIQGRKRDAEVCPADYQLCPKSMYGGCCPKDRTCGTSSCYATGTTSTSAPVFACLVEGYVACGIAEGGGCCPQSYVCVVDGCIPSTRDSYTETCGVGSYLCPASVGFGCCAIGFACGLSACYITSATAYTITETFLTTDASSLANTIITTIVLSTTPSIPTDITTGLAGNVPKVGSTTVISANTSTVSKVAPSPTTVLKTNAITVATSGLTAAQTGGIIGGVVAILFVVLASTLLAIRRLNRAIKGTTTKLADPISSNE